MEDKELPKYKCKKEVWAFKIEKIRGENGKIFLKPSDPGYNKIEVSHDYVNKHNPQIGGYYVRYKDGYESYSPAKAFEEGYDLIQ